MNQDYALVLQTDYNNVTAALCKDTSILQSITCHKHEASKNLIIHLDSLLEAQSIHWKSLSFIAVNQGPAPFTTLRAVITTANALAFAHTIPLIGVDGITTFLHAVQKKETVTIVLLNAFAHDLYYGIQDQNTVTTGWMHKDKLLQTLEDTYKERALYCTGNGVTLIQDDLQKTFSNITIAHPLTDYTPFESVVTKAYTQWHAHKTNTSLLPLYLKTKEYKIST